MTQKWIPIELAEDRDGERVVKSCLMRYSGGAAAGTVQDIVVPDKKFRVVIPKSVRDAVGLVPGSILAVGVGAEGIVMRILED